MPKRKPPLHKKSPVRKAEALLLRQERMNARRRVFLDKKEKIVNYGYKYMRTGLKEIEGAFKTNFSELIKKIINARGKASIIDLGCGEGVALRELRGLFPDDKKVILAGISLNYNPEWKKGKGIMWVVAPFYKLPKKFPKQRFDVAFSYYGLEYSPNLVRDFRAVWKILNEGGLLITTMPVFVEELDHEYIERKPEDYLKEIPGFKLVKAIKVKGKKRAEDSWILYLTKVPIKRK
ncbi:MAG: methyltransferase domain-containing protein [Candidatus Diapherotrites archaeon]|nr:methyltransferase domain-containing protein [Candidatus Diapherotrites archaeon]